MHLLAKEEITMAMVVKNNMSAINTLNVLNKNQSALGKSLAKVSSGQKINSAQDDASGYAISERMRVMVRALDQANQNTQNGSAMMKVAEGAVANTIEILKTLKEKAINAATDTNTDDDRKTIQKEIDQFIDQINDNALATFNGKYLVDGSKSAKTVSTATQLFNQNLSTDTVVASALSALRDRAGNSLNIASDDTVSITWVTQGQTHTINTFSGTSKLNEVLVVMTDTSGGTSTVDVTTGADTKFTDSANSNVNPVSGEAGVVVTAGTKGIDGQITGFTVSVVDKYGNTRKAANEFLEFKTEIFAANTNEDRALKIHVGAAAGQSISIGLADMRAEALGLQDAAGNVIKVSDPKKANGAIAAFDNALQKALDQATTIGAIEARLEYTSNNLTTESENVQAAESTIRDADMAKEMTNYTKNNVLLQAAQSMLAQANQNSSAVLSLLQ
jgi:flagellin